MKLKTFTRRVAAAAVALAALVPSTMSAYDFMEGGIYYNVNGQEATVTFGSQGYNSYSGNVVIPETVTHDGAVYTVTAIGDGAFGRSAGLTALTIPNTIKRIGDHCFAYCTGLKNVVIPNSVVKLGRCAFHTSGLQSIVIGNSVKVIDEYCFQYSSSLKKAVLGSSVDSLALKAFYDCPALKDVTCLAPVPPHMYAYYSFGTYSGKLTVSAGSLEAYRNDPNWGRFSYFETLTLAQTLTIDQSMITLHGGETQQLSATVLPAEASQALSWTSSDESVATVSSSGLVSAVSTGQAIITARTSDGSNLSATCAVRVLSNGVQTNNVLTLPQRLTVEKDKSFLLPVGMVNNAPVTGLQFDIELPHGFDLATDGESYLIDLLDERVTASHTLYVRELSSGVIRVMISSINSAVFVGNDGDLMVLHLDIAGDVADGEYGVTLTNVVLADASAMTYYAPDVNAIIEVKSYAKGDANGDGTVNVGDYVALVNYILAMDPDPFIFSAADVDENGAIDVGDLVGVANIILGDEVVAAKPASESGVALSGQCANAADRYVVTLDLSNEMALTAWQMDVTLPDGLTLEQAKLTTRAASHQLAVNNLDYGAVRLLGSSLTNDDLAGNEGALLTLELSGNAASDATLAFNNILFAERDMTRHVAHSFGVKAVSSAVNELTGNVRIYARDGKVIVETPVETTVEVVLSNGMSRTVTARAGVNTFDAGRGIYIVRAAGQVAKLKL